MEDATRSESSGIRPDRYMLRAKGEPPSAADLPPVERIMVEFAGEGAGVGGLSWGQVGLWDAMRRQRSWLPIGAMEPLPAGIGLPEVVDELRFVMSRYPTLRTRLRFDAGVEPDAASQVVSERGEVSLDVFDAPADADPAEVAELVLRYFSETEYDIAAEWPIRVAVIRHRGVLAYRVVVMCHLATDAFGASVMASELAARDRVTGAAAQPAAAVAPLEQARWQCSPAGQRQNDAGLRYCERVLRAVSARRFPEPTGKPSPRYWFGRFSSPALYLAVRAIATRTEQDSATVLLALFAIAHVRATGLDPMMIMVLVNNRFRPGLAETVSPITNAVPFAVDVAGASVEEVVAQTRGRTMTAFKYGYYDPLQFNRLVERLSRERGEEIDTGCYYNDRRMEFRDLPAGPPPSPAEVSAALSRTSFEWVLKQDEEAYEHLFLHLEDVPHEITMSTNIDTHVVSPVDVEACLRGMEAVAVATLDDPQASVL